MDTDKYSPFNKVVQDNILVKAIHRMNRNELLLFKQAVSQINSEKPIEKIVLEREDVFKILNVKKGTGSYYKLVKQYAEATGGTVIHIKEVDGETWMPLTIGINWSKNDDSVSIEFNPKLLPLLLNLKEKFTQYEIGYLSYLKSKYSIRLYELFKMVQFQGVWVVSIAEFRRVLDLEKKYKAQCDLDTYVLKPALKEININTDIRVSLEKKKKRGNKIESLIFRITDMNHNPNQFILNELGEIK